MKRLTINLMIITALCCSAKASVLPDYETFLQKVASQNTAYLAEKYAIDIALAGEQAARVFRDPELSFSYGNNQDWNLQMGQTFDVGLAYTIPLGGERAANIGAAKAEVEVTRAAVADYLRNLRQQAAEMYAMAWLAIQSEQVYHTTYLIMSEIAWGDSLRLAVGDTDKATAMQSQVEANLCYHQWQNALVEKQNALADLSLISGETLTGIADSILPIVPLPTASLEELQQRALTNRADLIRALAEKTLTQQQLRVIKAGQHLELTLEAGYTHAMRVNNEEAPAPPFDGFSVGFSLPLKFSSANKGTVRQAKEQVKQAEMNVQALQQQILTEVQQAYCAYAAKSRLMTTFTRTLADAAQVLHQRKRGYHKGDTSLLELIAARTAYNELYQTYLTDIADAFIAQATLATAIGE